MMSFKVPLRSFLGAGEFGLWRSVGTNHFIIARDIVQYVILTSFRKLLQLDWNFWKSFKKMVIVVYTLGYILVMLGIQQCVVDNTKVLCSTPYNDYHYLGVHFQHCYTFLYTHHSSEIRYSSFMKCPYLGKLLTIFLEYQNPYSFHHFSFCAK